MRTRNLFIALFITILLPITQDAWGSFPPRFSQLDIEDGLSMNTVNDIITDEQGYLWIATQSGLNRYDGKDITIFQADGSPSSTSGDDIAHLHLSRDGVLWLSTASDGLNRYNRTQQSFSHYLPKNTGLPKENITDLGEDNEGNLWIATSDKGVFVFSPESESVIRHYSSPEIPSDHVTSMHLHNDRLWIATLGGLMSYNQQTGLMEHKQVHGQILSITNEGYDTLWLAGNQLLYEYQLSVNQLVDRSDWLPDMHGGAEMLDIKADIYGNLWLSIRNQGLAQINDKGTQIHQPNAMDAGSLSSTTLGPLWLDKEAQLWIGTDGSGANWLNLVADSWHHIRPGALRNQDITTLNTRAIYRDSQGMLWVGTSQGLYQVVEEGQNIVDLTPYDSPWEGLSNSFISFIGEDAEGKLWIGTRGSGLLVLTRQYKLHRHYRNIPQDPTSLPADSLYQYFMDDSQRLWFTTRGGGVARFVGEGQGFVTIKDRFGSNETSDVLQDGEGNIWVSSYGGGLARISSDGTITRFSEDTDPAIPSKHLMTLEAIGNTIWAASSDGIFSFNPDTAEVKLFNMDNGLLNDAAYMMHKDNFDRIWVGTASGLSLVFPETGVIKNFSINDGIQGNEFNFGANFEESDGTLYFGGTHGFNQILAGHPLNSVKPAAPIIESVRLMSDTFWLEQLATPFGDGLSGIKLNYDTNLFTLFFHSPSLKDGSYLNYQYRLQGFNDNWFKVHNNQVNFTGLAPGTYLLQLRAANLSNEVSDITQLHIRIAPPPWQSWWAYGLYALMIMSILGLILYVWQQKFTVQQQLLLQLSRSEQRLQLALWSSGDEFWDWELKDGKVVRSNTFLRYPGEEANLKETVMATVHPDEQEAVVKAIKACLRGTSETIHVCYRGRAKDDEQWIWVELRGKATERNFDGTTERMTGTIKNIQALKDTEGELRLLNMELEDRVEARTQELSTSQDNLHTMVEELKLTREELKDKEKMATLGGLVASITHEMNTPIGVCVTASSNLLERIREFNHSYQCNQVSEGDFAQYQEDVEESCRLFLTNMNRISKLMNSFKHVAVDQSHEEVCQFNFNNYLMEILQSMEPMLKRTHHHYQIDCPDNLWLKTNPGVFYQIVSNLFNNSIMHAFEEGSPGKMNLSVTQLVDGIELRYQDDGCGMPQEVREQIFCPFFTTKRGQGGSGLGMNIVFNLVTQVLGGELKVYSNPGDGTEILINLPANLMIDQPRKEA